MKTKCITIHLRSACPLTPSAPSSACQRVLHTAAHERRRKRHQHMHTCSVHVTCKRSTLMCAGVCMMLPAGLPVYACVCSGEAAGARDYHRTVNIYSISFVYYRTHCAQFIFISTTSWLPAAAAAIYRQQHRHRGWSPMPLAVAAAALTPSFADE